MKVDTQPFPSVNMVEGYDRSARRQLEFALGINMAGPAIGPKKGERDISRRSK
jgi:hypothetical protein